MSEIEITKKIAEIVLSVVNDPKYPNLKDILVNEYHISRRMLTPDKLLHASGATFFRLMMGICQNVTEKEFQKMLDNIKGVTVAFSELEDGSPEALIKAHAGSTILFTP